MRSVLQKAGLVERKCIEIMGKYMTFSITDSDNIEVVRISDEEDIYRYEEVKIIYKRKEREYILYNNDFIVEAFSVLEILLYKAIAGELELHSSIKEKGIGFLSNEYFQNKPGLTMIDGEEGKFWVGDRYLLWESMGYQTWIYNFNREIKIEVTPTYKWHFDELDEKSINFISYEEFIKNYMSCFVITISKSTAETWLNKCKEINNKLN